MEAFAGIVHAGKAHYIGVSEWRPQEIRAAAELARELKIRLVSNQPQYSMLWRVIESEIVPLCEELGIGQVVWSPLAQGLLTGKRAFIVVSKEVALHKTPTASAEVVAMLEPEVVGEIRSCVGEWCRVRASGISGWLERTDIWGVYKSEPID